MARILFVLCILFSLNIAFALDAASQKAMKQTQDMLINKSQRKEAVKSGEAQKMDEYVSKLAHDDPKVIQKIYELAADIFPATVNAADGKPVEMRKLAGEYKDNPEAFINNLTPEQKRKLHEISIMLTPVTKD